MLRYILLLGGALLFLHPANAQTEQKSQAAEKLDALMDERDALLEQYQEYEQTNSSFWGTKSKSDLRNIISTLKGIIRKDTEIVRAVRASQVNKESSYITQNHFTSKRINELEAEVGKYQSLANRRYKEIADLEKAANKDSSFRFKYHLTILISIFLAAGMAFFAYKYIQLQRNQRSAASAM
ncbi:hypothetical protein AB9P05_14010 [Roseivirga sp. BDSF3-8]|uniref:hypothetical protein n=1 Tax=Roseivirga sp. BDSF3-8 TaxID=3241598 RepID=UPI00353208D7